MANRPPSSSSDSVTDTDDVSTRERQFSENSHSELQKRPESATNTVDAASIADTMTQRTASPTASHVSTTVSGKPYEASSVKTSNTGVTDATSITQKQQVVGGIPIIRPPALPQQQSGTGIGVFGPQRPPGYSTQPPTVATHSANQHPIQIDVAAAQQQYQQRAVQPEISPYGGSTVSTSSGSLSSPDTSSLQHQSHSSVRVTGNRQGVNQNYSDIGQAFQQQASTNYSHVTGPQLQAQFPNQIPAHQVYNELLGPDAFKDVILDIDYGVLGGFNAAFQSGTDYLDGQLPPGINVRPAYTTVDSLNYQQHMFNTARNVHAGGENNSYDFSGLANSYNVTGTASSAYSGQQFDVAKAVFNQADLNHDGKITQQEFQQWIQGGQQVYGGQSYTNAAAAAAAAATTNYQTNVSNYTNGNNSFYHSSVFNGANQDVAKILQESGLGQVVPNQ